MLQSSLPFPQGRRRPLPPTKLTNQLHKQSQSAPCPRKCPNSTYQLIQKAALSQQGCPRPHPPFRSQSAYQESESADSQMGLFRENCPLKSSAMQKGMGTPWCPPLSTPGPSLSLNNKEVNQTQLSGHFFLVLLKKKKNSGGGRGWGEKERQDITANQQVPKSPPS